METPPAGATTIVLNWHWSCADAPPPPLDVGSVTVCASCNVSISVRVGSPGDSGDLVQTIAAQATAASDDVAQTLQDAVQAPAPTISEVPVFQEPIYQQPVPLPPVVPAPAEAALTAPFAAARVILDATAHALGPPIDAGIFTGSLDFAGSLDDPTAEDPPRRGAPPSFGVAKAPAQQPSLAPPRTVAGAMAGAIAPSSGVLGGSIVISQRSPAGRGTRAAARHPARAPAPLRPPPAPTPVVLAAGASPAAGGGPGAVAASAGAFVLILLYAVYAALRSRPAVPPARDGGAKPHPPG